MCHESCEENGSIIESAVGWAGKCEIVRSNGKQMRKSTSEALTIEAVRDSWNSVTDMTNAKHLDSIQAVTGELMNSMQITSNDTQDSGKSTFEFNERDLIIYALGGKKKDELTPPLRRPFFESKIERVVK